MQCWFYRHDSGKIIKVADLIGCGRQYDWKRKETKQTGKQNTGLLITQKM
ncbi:hypothetical protein [Bacillus siamensis]|nr:hypothetical protein [Bacillus siamensis]